MLYNAEEVITTCVNVIARNFSYIYNANYNILPYRYVVSWVCRLHSVFSLVAIGTGLIDARACTFGRARAGCS